MKFENERHLLSDFKTSRKLIGFKALPEIVKNAKCPIIADIHYN